MFAHTVSVVYEAFDDGVGFDTAVSHALLDRASDGEIGDTFRVTVPGPVVAFGKRDVHSPGFRTAVQIAHDHGYDAVVRLPGGRAAVFYDRTISFSWTTPADDPITGVRDRFAHVAATITRALARLAVPSGIGEIPGEYCPGEFSVHHAGRIKIAGIGQRLARRAAHVGGVLVVGDTRRAAEVLVPVYDALGLPLDPSTIGAVEDVRPGIDTGTVVAAIVAAIAEQARIAVVPIAPVTLERAALLAPLHVPNLADLA